MVWNPASAKWQRGINAVRAFREEGGHRIVSRGFVTGDGLRLGNWLDSRRAEYRLGSLVPERAAELRELGLVDHRVPGRR
jgi:hypothetical protein